MTLRIYLISSFCSKWKGVAGSFCSSFEPRLSHSHQVEVDSGYKTSPESAVLAPAPRPRETRSLQASLVNDPLVESSLEELLVPLAGVEAVVEAAVRTQAADEAGGGGRGGRWSGKLILLVKVRVSSAQPTFCFAPHTSTSFSLVHT